MGNASTKPVRYSIRDAGDAIRRRETFVAGDGSLTGGHLAPNAVFDVGRMSADTMRQLDRAYRSSEPFYVVYSYGTPIAWAGPGELLTVPDVRYSVTTSRHQGIARRADDPRCIDSQGAPVADCRCWPARRVCANT